MRKSVLDKLRELKAKKNKNVVPTETPKETARKDVSFLPPSSSSTVITEHINSRIDSLVTAAGGPDYYEDKGTSVNFIDNEKGYIIVIEYTKTEEA